MAWNTPQTWVPGPGGISALLLNTQVRDNFKAIGDAWTSYTPAWSTTGTVPTLGDGTLEGNYAQAGKLVLFSIILTIGTTTTVGTGVYTLTLPVATALPPNAAVASAHFFDASPAGYYQHIAYRTATSASQIALSATAGRWSATNPVVPAVGDVISVNGSYEAA